jgi:hypothetical protein
LTEYGLLSNKYVPPVKLGTIYQDSYQEQGLLL